MRVWPIEVGKALGRMGVAGHIAVRKQGGKSSDLVPSAFHSGDPGHGAVPPTIQLGPPRSVNTLTARSNGASPIKPTAKVDSTGLTGRKRCYS